MSELRVQKNKVLAGMTTFKLGGSADSFCTAITKEDLKQAYSWAEENDKEVLILGGCSNVVISDDGYRGLVVKMANTDISVLGKRIRCGAGAFLADLARVSFGNNYTGLEWSVGIPGATVGGSIRGNAGAFGSELGELVETVEVFDTVKKSYSRLSRQDCEFKYRGSAFKENPNLVIWEVVFQFSALPKVEMQKKIDICLKKRFASQPKLPSAGCIFKNLTLAQITKMNKKVAELAKQENVVKGGKVGAGWLINKAGWKGKRQGGVKVSLEHANFIVNTGKGSAGDVKGLTERIKKDVLMKYRINLKEEVEFIGF